MNFACLSEAEVWEKYHKAEDKEYIIEVLAGLTDSTHVEMRAFLGLDEKRNKRKSLIEQIDTEEAKRLHAQGLSDAAIAKNLNVSKTFIRNWRTRNGIRCNSEKSDRRESLEVRMELYKQGLSDREIGRRVGVSNNAI